MDFNNWNVDLDSCSAFHPTGFKLSVEGSPLQPVGVSPGNFPEGLSAVEQARLLRCGLKAIMSAARTMQLETT